MSAMEELDDTEVTSVSTPLASFNATADTKPNLTFTVMKIQNVSFFALALFGNLTLLFIMLFGRSMRARAAGRSTQATSSHLQHKMGHATSRKDAQSGMTVLTRLRLAAPLTPVQILILHNCAADLSFAFFGFLPSYLDMITRIYHCWFCKIGRFLSVFPMYASAFLLVAISADRFQAVCRPLASMTSDKRKRPNVYAAMAWVTAIICSIPQLFTFKLQRMYSVRSNTTYILCWSVLNPTESKAYTLAFSTVAWLVPTCAASYLYGRVCLTVWRSMASKGPCESMAEMAMAGTSTAAPSISNIRKMTSLIKRASRTSETELKTQDNRVQAELTPQREHLLSAHNKMQHVRRGTAEQTTDYLQRLRKSEVYSKRDNDQMQKRVRAVKLTLTIVACNFFLWSPFCLTNIVVAFDPEFFKPQMATYLMMIGNLNCCVNPWIYIFFNMDQVKQAMRCGKPSPTTNTSPNKNNNTPTSRKNTVETTTTCSGTRRMYTTSTTIRSTNGFKEHNNLIELSGETPTSTAQSRRDNEIPEITNSSSAQVMLSKNVSNGECTVDEPMYSAESRHQSNDAQTSADRKMFVTVMLTQI